MNKIKVKHEILFVSLIGKQIKILGSKNKNQIGQKGTIVYESANLLYVEENNKIKRFLKNNIVFQIEFEGKPLKVDGRLLLSTVLSRIKKFR